MKDFERLTKWVNSIYGIDIKDATLPQIYTALSQIAEEDDIILEEEEIENFNVY